MNDLRELLQSKLDWIETTRGQTHVNVKLSGEQLETLCKAVKYLDACNQATKALEKAEPDLPKIDPRTFGFRKPLTNCA